MLPVMVASGFSGPIAGLLVSRLGLREVATGGCRSAPSAFSAWRRLISVPSRAGLGADDALGFSVAASALLASSSAIMGGSAEGESGSRGRLKPWPMSWAPVSA